MAAKCKISDDKTIEIGKLLNDSDRPLKERFRALFTLRGIDNELAIGEIARCFSDESALLKHELAYCLGQMQNPKAIPYLIKVLEDVSQEPMVRHEAGEALGAIGHPDVVAVLEKYQNDPAVEVAETCEIALERVKWHLAQKENPSADLTDKSLYETVDPSPATQIDDINELTNILLNEDETLFKRYQAMFRLRNLNTAASINAIGKGLKCKSALFRHEIAFVLGQIQHEDSIDVLAENLRDDEEHEMVRHECAEALGAIATDKCVEILNEYMNDDKRVVRESCIVALDMTDYTNSPEFQYANALSLV